MKVLVTGAAGFIGPHVVSVLRRFKFDVRALDSLIYGTTGAAAILCDPKVEFVKGDIREPGVVKEAMDGMDAVVHLAAIVGGPACKKDTAYATQVNVTGTQVVLEQAMRAKIGTFIFASTCSNYGASEPGFHASEDSPLDPLSIYSDTKVASEHDVLAANGKGLCSVVLRFATAFGLSPRMRFDLMLNEFVLDARWSKSLTIYNADAWRPFCHARDIARAICIVLDRCRWQTWQYEGQAFNVGGFNLQKSALAGMIQKHIPDLNIIWKDTGGDKRNYRVNFSKFRDVCGFEPVYTIEDGIKGVLSALDANVFPSPYSKYWRNA